MTTPSPFRILALVVALSSGLYGMAQLPAPLRPLLLGDTIAPPRYDTAYIHSHRSAFSIGYVSSVQNAVISLSDSLGRELDHSTNNPTQYGLGFSLGWLSGEFTFSIPGVSVADPQKGETDSRNYGLGITGRRLIGRAFFNSSKGFFPEQAAIADSTWQPGEPYPVRPDIQSNTFLASANYAISHKRRFSFKAALYQNERQKRSAGTFLAGGTVWINDIQSSEPFVPTAASANFVGNTAFDRIQRTVIGATFGYTHTFVFFRKAFVTATLVPGLSAQQQRIALSGGAADESDWQVGGVAEFKFGVGYNGDRFYTAITGANYFSSGDTDEGVNITTGFRFVRFTLGVRIKQPNSGFLRGLGLSN
ncbi:MAG: DUF4421 family protein [Flavobacteriales bacterium]